MAEYTPPKTNWTEEDGVADADLNRIEKNIEYLKEQIDLSRTYAP